MRGIGAADWPGKGPFPFPRILPRSQSPNTTNKANAVVDGSRGTLGVVNAAGGAISPFVGPAIQPFTINGLMVKGSIPPTKEGTATAIAGTVTISGTLTAGVAVSAYDEVSGYLIGQTTTNGSGAFSIPAKGYTSVKVVAETSGYDALIYSIVVPI